VAGQVGFDDRVAIDIGGTLAGIALVRSGQPGITTNSRIADWRVTLPVVDLTTMGADGGSLARLSETGGLVVGPRSARPATEGSAAGSRRSSYPAALPSAAWISKPVV
jgi:N-methylhydantoinase A